MILKSNRKLQNGRIGLNGRLVQDHATAVLHTNFENAKHLAAEVTILDIKFAICRWVNLYF